MSDAVFLKTENGARSLVMMVCFITKPQNSKLDTERDVFRWSYMQAYGVRPAVFRLVMDVLGPI
jgi:hypothetical protein